ncbi:MAG: hypothetical protein HZA35_03540 [Parcubacteria group bacterium]|nr:hypothetical protein [Parcubacteria group bacterium]
MLTYARHFFSALGFSIVIETIILLWIVRGVFRIKKEGASFGRLVLVGFFATFATIPYVWYVFPVVFYDSWRKALILSEFFAVLVEAVFYKYILGLSWKRALSVSLVCNASSFFLGRIKNTVLYGSVFSLW